MLTGSISTVMSPDMSVSERYASALGKRVESGIFYRKLGDSLRSVLVPDPLKVLDDARDISVSSTFYLFVNGVGRVEAELALLAEASGISGIVVSQDPETFKKMFESMNISKMLSDFKELDLKPKDSGITFIDRVFNVKGVGTVMLGFSGTEIYVHDKLIALPSNAEIDIKSIQVLDEDQPSVGPGVRVGLAIRNADLNALSGTYGLIKPGLPLIDELGAPEKFKWAPETKELHVICCGMKVMGDMDQGRIKLRGKLPAVGGRAILINPNVKPGSLQVYGYALNNSSV
ncbi:MAG: translation elongation factor [Nitrososphaeria archaeon]